MKVEIYDVIVTRKHLIRLKMIFLKAVPTTSIIPDIRVAVFIHVWALGFYVGKTLPAKIVGNMAYYYVIIAEHIRFPTFNSRRHLISTLLTSTKIYYNKTRSSPLLYSFR